MKRSNLNGMYVTFVRNDESYAGYLTAYSFMIKISQFPRPVREGFSLQETLVLLTICMMTIEIYRSGADWIPRMWKKSPNLPKWSASGCGYHAVIAENRTERRILDDDGNEWKSLWIFWVLFHFRSFAPCVCVCVCAICCIKVFHFMMAQQFFSLECAEWNSNICVYYRRATWWRNKAVEGSNENKLHYAILGCWNWTLNNRGDKER